MCGVAGNLHKHWLRYLSMLFILFEMNHHENWNTKNYDWIMQCYELASMDIPQNQRKQRVVWWYAIVRCLLYPKCNRIDFLFHLKIIAYSIYFWSWNVVWNMLIGVLFRTYYQMSFDFCKLRYLVIYRGPACRKYCHIFKFYFKKYCETLLH